MLQHTPWCRRGERACAAVAFVLLAANIVMTQARAEPIWSLRIRVIDGDTIKIDGDGPSVDLFGFAAPKIEDAQCDAERDLGGKAARRLRDLVRTGPLEFSYVACACSQGTKRMTSENDSRRCGTLMSAGKDVGAVLTSEGMAASVVCSTARRPEMPQPWCGGH